MNDMRECDEIILVGSGESYDGGERRVRRDTRGVRGERGTRRRGGRSPGRKFNSMNLKIIWVNFRQFYGRFFNPF